jgi:hypothetical protein
MNWWPAGGRKEQKAAKKNAEGLNAAKAELSSGFGYGLLLLN